MSLFYTGVGSRETPDFVCRAMTDIAVILEDAGLILRSGGADGADAAFEEGVTHLKEIYLPWEGFNGNDSRLFGVCDKAVELALQIHPAPQKLLNRPKALKLHARNCYQVLGKDLSTPSDFLICWTEGAKKSGGTRTAIVLAEKNKIPILNLGLCNSYEECIHAFDRFIILVA